MGTMHVSAHSGDDLREFNAVIQIYKTFDPPDRYGVTLGHVVGIWDPVSPFTGVCPARPLADI